MEITSNLLICEGSLNKETKISCNILIIDGDCDAKISDCQTDNILDSFANTPEGLYLSEKVEYSDGAAYSSSTKVKHRQGSFGVLSSC